MQAALLARAAHELFRNVPAIETIVGRKNGFAPGLARFQRIRFGIHEFLQRGQQIGLTPNFSSARHFILAARKENLFRVRPLNEFRFVTLDLVYQFLLNCVAIRHLHRWRENFLQRQRPEFSKHHHQAARIPRRHGGERALRWRILRRVGLHLWKIQKELRRGSCRRDAERVDADHLLRFRIVNQRLRLAAPTHVVIHRADNGKHGARGVNCVAAALENSRARHCAQRLPRNRYPMARVQHRLVSAGKRFRRSRKRQRSEHCEQEKHTNVHGCTEPIRPAPRGNALPTCRPRFNSQPGLESK